MVKALENETLDPIGSTRTNSTNSPRSYLSQSPNNHQEAGSQSTWLQRWHRQLGLNVLLQSQSHWQDDNSSWACLAGQISLVDDALSKALALLGAIYETQFLPVTSPQPILVVVRNQQAVASLMKGIEDRLSTPTAIFLTSVVLTAAEALQRHFINAAMHLRGAFQALTHMCFPDKLVRSFLTSEATISDSTFATNKDVLQILAYSLDLQTSWFALDRPPQLKQNFNPITSNAPLNGLLDSETEILFVLHSCYHFANRAAKFKYIARNNTPVGLVLEQSRYIAALNRCLSETSSRYQQLYSSSVRKVQCLSTLVYLSNILSAFETTYDEYTVHFQQIVATSEIILRLSQTNKPHMPFYQLEPGIFQAIYLTGSKCRHPILRRQALELLDQIGIEGPWHNRAMRQVLQRGIEIEECGQAYRDLGTHLVIPERQRLHGCGMDSTPLEGGRTVHVQAHFSLCKDVDAMIRSDDYENSRHWILWSEEFETI